ncbi:MAG: hypothetical protein IT380_28625 [Myxococcales bacterium]|nr:hypothetical protein [Myxococcales bacterium]
MSPLRLRFVALCLSVPALVSSCTCGKPPPTTPTLKNKGEVCAQDEECATGLCDAAPGFQTVCVAKCSSGCTADEICTQLTPNRFSCAQDEGGLCRPCAADSDCPYPADKCLVVDGLNVCGRDCTFDQTCPTSYRCLSGVGADGKAKANQCQPSSGSCTCTASSAGQTISCEVMNGLGTCRGVRTCDGVAGYGACDAKTPAQEDCNGLDDDCDGTVDEDQPMVTCGVGACLRSQPLCGDGGVLTCTPGQPSTETCNSVDDDCDGTVDNGFDVTSNVLHCGACNSPCMLAHATPRCANRACEVQSCDPSWGNCDGLHGNGCEADLLTDPNHCSACGNRCTAPGTTGSCVGGMCQFQCAMGFYNLDGDWANGCEYACTFTSSTDLPDIAFTDANCDGMDGELTNGIYVSPAGDDTYAGTMAQPRRTIAAGVAAAVQQSKRDVYVSAGSYSGPVALTNVTGVNVAGGYAPGATRWTRSVINSTIVVGGSPSLSLTNVDNSLVQFITFRADTAAGQEPNGNGRSSYGGQVRDSSNLKLELLTVVAGDGSNGNAGASGMTGGNGSNGTPGARGCANDSYLGCSTCSRPSGGSGGTSACSRTGGTGGVPGYAYSSQGPGGTGGQGVIGTSAGTGGPSYTGGNAFGTPQPNQRGADGTSGTNGANGGLSPALGTLSVAGYLPPLGAPSTSGTNGNGGGGGGGGGGGCQDWEVLGVLQFCWCYTYGSSGGGGGGGGCAGMAGGNGRGGGGSIALVLWNSQVVAQNLALQSARGGNGGNGGSGGAGGWGGVGASSVHDWGNQGYSGIGGRGGNGGVGGAGGHGSGGAGGPSIGLLRNAGSTINTSQVSYSLGSAGTGGSSVGFPGPAGTVAQDQTL